MSVKESGGGEDVSKRSVQEPILNPWVWVLFTTGVLSVLTLWHSWQQARTRRAQPAFTLAFVDRGLAESVGPYAGRSGSEETSQWTPVRARYGTYCPIVRWPLVGQVADGRFVARGYQVEANGCFRPPWRHVRTGCLVASIALVGFATLLVARRLRFRYLCLALVLLRCAALLWSFGAFGFYSIHADDEQIYLETARRMLDWSLPPTPYSIGNPTLYLPLLVLLPHLGEFSRIALQGFAWFAVFGCLVPVLLAWLALKLKAGRSTAFPGALAIVVFPWWMQICQPSEGPVFTFGGHPLGVTMSTNWISTYYFTDYIGYNAMSDMPALFFGILGLVLCVGGSRARLVLGGLLLGWSLSVRISNVFYALPVALILLQTQAARLRAFACVGAGAVLGFLPQLAWNACLFGHPLTFGYSLRAEDYKGFQLALAPQGLDLFGTAHQQLLILAALALLTVTRQQRRFALAVTALALATLTFYSGYHAVSMNPVRFFLTPLTLLMCVAGSLLAATGERLRLNFAVIALCVLLVPGLPLIACLVPVPPFVSQLPVLVLGAWIWLQHRTDYWQHLLALILLLIASAYLTVFVVVMAASRLAIAELRAAVGHTDGEQGHEDLKNANT